MKRFPAILLVPFALAAAAARGTDYWQIADDTQSSNNSSLSGTGEFGGWSDAPDGTDKVAFGKSYGAVDPDGVYHMRGHGIRAPFASSYAFQGAELVFDGTNPFVNDRINEKYTFTIGSLRVVSGTHGEIRNGDNKQTKTLAGTNWVVEAGATLGLNTGDRGQTPSPRHFVCSATVSGEGTLAATAGIGGIASIEGSVTLTGDLSRFAGILSAGEKGATYTGTHADAVTNHRLAVAAPSALPWATPGGLPLAGAVVVTNGATISFSCDAASSVLRGWDFGGGATPTVDVADGCTVTVLGPVSGTAGLVKTGGGTLVLDAGGEGEFGRLVLAGETNVSAAALAAYAAACAPLPGRCADASLPFVEVAPPVPGYRTIRVPAAVARTGTGAETVRVTYRVAATPEGLETAPETVAHEALAAGADASFSVGGLPNGEPCYVRVRVENALGSHAESAVFSAVPCGFDWGAALAVSGYGASAPALEGLLVPVRIAEGSPEGFSYAALHSPADGADLAFFDTAGIGLPFEIDTWNTNGASLVWVRLPYAAGGTPFEMRWGSDVSGKDICPDNPWTDYAGVWHMGEPGDGVTAILDSTTNGLHAAAPSGSRERPDGRFGGARTPARSGTNGVPQCIKVDLSEGNRRAVVDGINTEENGHSFTVSMWVRPQLYDGDGNPNQQYLVGRKNGDNTPAWGVQYHSGGDYGKIRVWSRETAASNVRVFDFDDSAVPSDASECLGRWFKYDVVYSGDGATFYVDGGTNALSVLSEKMPGGVASNGVENLFFGGTPGWGTRLFCGDMDEVRIRAGAADPEWIAADWAAQADPAFLAAAPARSLAETGDPEAGLAVADAAFDSVSLNASVDTPGAGASSADVLVEVVREDVPGIVLRAESYSVAGPDLRVLEIPRLSPGTAYLARIAVTNSLGASAGFGPLRFKTKAAGAPSGTAALRGRESAGFDVQATLRSVGTGASSARMRLEASTSETFETVVAVSREIPAEPGVPATLSVSRLAPGTRYWLRVRFVNDWRIESFFPLGSESTQRPVYVDSLAPAGGDGSTPERAFQTIREGVDAADAHCTVWVRGGPDRAYGVTNETDTLPIPATLEGLSIRAYGETPGDGVRAPVAISDTYVADGNRAHVISNAAANVTVDGFEFSFGTSSIGMDKVGGCSIVRTEAPFTTVENCRFRLPRPTGYGGSGASDGRSIVECPTGRPASNLVVRGCGFYNTRTVNRYHNFAPPVRCANNGLVVGNVFSNVNWTAATRGDRFSFVSNVVYGANEDTSGERSGILLNSGRDAEIAYNVLSADPASDKRHVVFFGFWRAWTGDVLIHHNTCIGGSVLVFGGGPLVSESRRKPKIFSNLFVPDGVGTNIVEDPGTYKINNVDTYYTNFYANVPTTFRPGSVFRNNAYPDTTIFNGGLATQLVPNYQLIGDDGLFVADNIALASPPDWVCTNDVFHADFYRYRSRHGSGDLGYAGWRGEHGEYPPWVGAKPPLYPEPTLLILR